MIPFKLQQPVKTSDGRIGRILFYTDYTRANGDHKPASAVVLFVNKWSLKYPISDLTPIRLDEYDEAVKADKNAVQAILSNLPVTERHI